MAEICLTEFRSGSDTETFAHAAEFCRTHPGTTLTIPAGTYVITDPLARAAMEHVMKGDWGSNPQRVMFNPHYAYACGFDLSGARDVTVSAYGAVMMIDGFMEPVTIAGCENVELCGLTVDHVRKPFSEGKVEILSKILAGEEAGKTNAVRRLDTLGADYRLHEYEGLMSAVEVAGTLGQPPERVFKTLVTVGKS